MKITLFLLLLLLSQLDKVAAQSGQEREVATLMLSLQENAYVHVNKPYYYPKERLWYKVYMLYADYGYRDSLSRVLHVVLLSPNETPIRHDQLSISDGVAWGDMYLPDSLSSGTYFLKIYTHWMLNYGDSTTTYVPIRILEPNTRPVAGEKPDLTCQSIQTRIIIEPTYKKISMEVTNHALHNYSVSVTDTSLIQKIPTLPFTPKFLTEVAENRFPKVSYPIERGLQTGITLNGKRKWVAGQQVLAVRQTPKMFETLTTDEKGRLHWDVPPGQPTETILFSLVSQPEQAISIILDKQPNPATRLPIVPGLDVRTGVGNVADFDTLERQAVQLAPVQVKAKKLVPNTAVKLYSRADATINGGDILRAQVDNPILALQGRVPGVQITTVNQRIVMNIRNSQQSSFKGQITDPLVLVNGVPMAISSLNDVAAISPQTIDHIDVLKSVRSIYGTRGSNGIIAIYTRQESSQTGTTAAIDNKQTAIPVIFKGYTPQHTFASNEANPGRVRATPFWAPNVRVGTSPDTIQFQVGLTPATYRVEVVGVQTDGSILKCVKYVSVK